VPGNCDTDDPALRLVAGDAHMAACHYAEELAGVTIESLREQIDVSAESELVDADVPSEVYLPPGEPEEDAVVRDVAVAEGTAHPGVIEFAEDSGDAWPSIDDTSDREVNP
jgi:hypothetical protein